MMTKKEKKADISIKILTVWANPEEKNQLTYR